ncbi:hypothetical protein D3C75_367100 [compost metagenome]
MPAHTAYATPTGTLRTTRVSIQKAIPYPTMTSTSGSGVLKPLTAFIETVAITSAQMAMAR